MNGRFFLMGLLLSSPLLAEGEGVDPNAKTFQTLIYIAIGILFFYLILWRPEQKRRKALELQRSQIKKGDQVIVAGIIGEVQQIQEKTLIVKLHDGAKMEVLKGAIIEVYPKEEKSS